MPVQSRRASLLRVPRDLLGRQGPSWAEPTLRLPRVSSPRCFGQTQPLRRREGVLQRPKTVALDLLRRVESCHVQLQHQSIVLRLAHERDADSRRSPSTHPQASELSRRPECLRYGLPQNSASATCEDVRGGARQLPPKPLPPLAQDQALARQRRWKRDLRETKLPCASVL